MNSERLVQVMTAPVIRAWFEVSTSDDAVAAVNRHYHVAEVTSGLPPTRLLVEWREAGHPDPSDWIREKVEAIIQEDAA